MRKTIIICLLGVLGSVGYCETVYSLKELQGDKASLRLEMKMQRIELTDLPKHRADTIEAMMRSCPILLSCWRKRLSRCTPQSHLPSETTPKPIRIYRSSFPMLPEPG